MPGLVKEWFIPGDGIDRGVITSDIQRYLGNDATVRPGVGTGQDAGVRGYWVKAYRALTTAMVEDLRASSSRWIAEQRRTGTREPYPESQAYAAAGGGMPQRHAGDSPLGPMDPRHGAGPAGRTNRMPDRVRPDDAMAIDTPYGQPPPSRFADRERYDEMDYRTQEPPEPMGYAGREPAQRGQFPPHVRDHYPPNNYPPDPRFQGRMPEPDVRHGRDYRDPNDAPGYPGYNDGRGAYRDPRGPAYTGNGADFGGRPVEYNAGPPNAPYSGPPPPMQAPTRGMDPSFAQQFGGPPGPPRNDRDPRMPPQSAGFGQDMRDPRDPRYAYPSPAQSTVDPRDNVQSPPQHITFGHGGPPQPPQSGPNPQFDQFGGRPSQPPMTNAFPGQPGQPSGLPGSMAGVLPGTVPRQPQSNLGARLTGPTNNNSNMDGDPRDRQRRRLQ